MKIAFQSFFRAAHASTIAAAFAFSASSFGAVIYSIVPVSPSASVDWNYSKVINNARQVVGGSNSRAFFWTQAGGLIDLGTLPGGFFSSACSINNSGQVVGHSSTGSGYDHAFFWTQGGGMVDLGTLPTGTSSRACAINNSGQVAGSATNASGADRAFSWTMIGGMFDLGTLGGSSFSYAYAVNNVGQVVGNASDANATPRAFSWTQGGGMVDLGTLPGDTRAFAYAINDNGQVVGESTNASLFPRHGFVWTQPGGMVDLGNLGNNLTFVLAINNSGQVIGYSYTSGLIRAFSWTQGGGMVNIGLPSGFHSTPFAVNNAGQIVGYAYNSSFVQHAFVWSPSGGIVDLNDAIPIKPSGWEVSLAWGISDDGAIVATSTSGLVLLVPEIVSSSAPVAGPIGANDPVAAGSLVSISASFTDADATDTHTATWDWGDGSTPDAGVVTESNGSGTVTGSHTYLTAGVYSVELTITDNTARSVQVMRDVVVYDASAGFVTGTGWIQSPPGAYKANESIAGRATFGFVSQYKKGATTPTGNTEFAFRAVNLNFHSDTYKWLVVAGARAQFKGVGTINGSGVYEFMLTAIDGNRLGKGTADRFRIKIWYYDPTLQMDVVIYDNQIDSSSIGTSTEGIAIGGGSIEINTK